MSTNVIVSKLPTNPLPSAEGWAGRPSVDVLPALTTIPADTPEQREAVDNLILAVMDIFELYDADIAHASVRGVLDTIWRHTHLKPKPGIDRQREAE